MSQPETQRPQDINPAPESPSREAAEKGAARPKEIGGPKGPEPTRYGDWEKNGRCIDF